MRMTFSRDGKHSDTDPMSCIALGAALLVVSPVFAVVAYLPDVLAGMLAPSLLVVTSVVAIIVRGIVLFADRFIRPAVFDREQRQHEAVPYCCTTEEATQDA
jgi:hypothetical protein